MVERFREKLTNEHLADRIARMLAQLHEAADAGGAASEPRTQDLVPPDPPLRPRKKPDRKSTRLNSSHSQISYAVFCLKKKKKLNSTADKTLVGIPIKTWRRSRSLLKVLHLHTQMR